MLTTVVGSYPAQSQPPKSMGEKISNFMGNYDEYRPALTKAVSDQIKAGVDLVSDGQVRGDMIEIFARAIPGMVIEDNTCKIRNKISPPLKSIGAEDLKLAIKTVENTLKEMNFSEEEMAQKGVKGIITGPTTMVYSSRLDGFYSNEQKDKAILDMASALKKEAHYLEEAGASVIQLDEPFISTGMVNVATARKAVEIIAKDIKIPVAMHVCGDVEQVFDKILQFKVDIIDCEFAGIAKNVQLLEGQKSFYGKKIGFGSVDTKKESIETVDEIKNLIKTGMDIIGPENMLIDPDCGMRMLPYKSAYSKLKNMVEAARTLSNPK